jgi:hypothetical protein
MLVARNVAAFSKTRVLIRPHEVHHDQLGAVKWTAMQMGAPSVLHRERVLSYSMHSRTAEQCPNDVVAILSIIGIRRLQRLARHGHERKAE